jgi:hypothetical protein
MGSSVITNLLDASGMMREGYPRSSAAVTIG